MRIGISLFGFFAGRVVEIPRIEYFGISDLRILYVCTIFQNVNGILLVVTGYWYKTVDNFRFLFLTCRAALFCTKTEF